MLRESKAAKLARAAAPKPDSLARAIPVPARVGPPPDRLGIGISTVRTHLQHIYGKLPVSNRTEAVVKFLGR
jgi:hypothetical protein